MLDGLTDLQVAAGERLQAHDGLEQGGLTHAVGTDHAHDAVARQGEGEIVDEHAAVELLVQVLGHQDLGAQTRAHGDADIGIVDLLAGASLGLHLLVTGQTRLVLGLACLRGGTHPVELGDDALGQALLALTLSGGASGLGLEIGGVVALIGVEVTAVDLANPLGHVVEEVAICVTASTAPG